MERHVFHIAGKTVQVKRGDLTEERVDAVVNAANNRLIMGGGIAGALRRKGGDAIDREAQSKGPIAVGGAVATTAGNLPSRYVIHAVTMAMDFSTDAEKIRAATANALACAGTLALSSIAFPALGCGVGHFSPEEAARIMAQEILKALLASPSLADARVVLFDAETFDVFLREFETYLAGLTGKTFRNPFPTADILIRMPGGIVLVERKNYPFGWAIPGGFADYGESLEETAAREAREETSLELADLRQWHTFSRFGRDPRFHTICTVFTADGRGEPRAADDAAAIGVFSSSALPERMAFDHRDILAMYAQEWGTF